MNKHAESLLGALLYGAALGALFFVGPMRIEIDPQHFTVLDVYVLPVALMVAGLWVTFGLLGAYPDMRAAHLALIVLVALVPIILAIVQAHGVTLKLF